MKKGLAFLFGLSLWGSAAVAGSINDGTIKLFDDDLSNYILFDTPSAVTSNRTCTLQDEAALIPYTCVDLADAESTLEGFLDLPDLQGVLGASKLDTDSVSADELNAAGVEAELEAVLDINELQGLATAANLGTDSVSADELNATGVESELESVLDLPDLQGSLTLAGDVDGSHGSNDLDEASVESELEGVIDLADLQGILTVAKGGTGAAPGADDQLIVSDSTSAATWRSLPDCDADGQTLNYDQATNAFSCGDDDGGAGGGMSTTDIDTSAELAGIVTDETGTGALVFGTAPDITISATTEGNIETAIDTLANLTSIQSRTVTLADAGANAVFGWDDAAGAYENLTAAELEDILEGADGAGSGLDADLLDGQSSAAFAASSHTHAGADITDFESVAESAIDTLANLTSVQGFTVTLADAGANAFFGWDDTAGAYENLTAGEAATIIAGQEATLEAVLDLADLQGSLTLAGDVDGAHGSNDIDEAAVETELESVLDKNDLQGDLTLAGDIDGAHGSNDIDEAAVETELESVLDINQLQGEATAANLAADSVDSSEIVNSALVQSLCFAMSDETTSLTTGTAKITFRMPYAFTLSDVRASVNGASSSGVITVDINEGGSTIMTTNKLTIDANEETSVTAATAVGITDSSLADDAEITGDIDGAGTSAEGLKVCFIGYKT